MRSIARTTVIRLFVVLLLVAMTSPVAAETIEDKVPFELDTWYDIDVEDGPVTVHRIRVRLLKAGVKSKIFRPGKSQYTSDVRVEIEYTNEASRDYEAKLSVHWLDEDGNIIDGVVAKEDFDDDERHETTSNTLSTLTYGLDVAKYLEYDIRW